MALAAAHELARFAVDRHLDESHLLPTMEEWEVFPLVAAATGMAAQEEGVARLQADADELHERARRIIGEARRAAVSAVAGT